MGIRRRAGSSGTGAGRAYQTRVGNQVGVAAGKGVSQRVGRGIPIGHREGAGGQSAAKRYRDIGDRAKYRCLHDLDRYDLGGVAAGASSKPWSGHGQRVAGGAGVGHFIEVVHQIVQGGVDVGHAAAESHGGIGGAITRGEGQAGGLAQGDGTLGNRQGKGQWLGGAIALNGQFLLIRIAEGQKLGVGNNLLAGVCKAGDRRARADIVLTKTGEIDGSVGSKYHIARVGDCGGGVYAQNAAGGAGSNQHGAVEVADQADGFQGKAGINEAAAIHTYALVRGRRPGGERGHHAGGRIQQPYVASIHSVAHQQLARWREGDPGRHVEPCGGPGAVHIPGSSRQAGDGGHLAVLDLADDMVPLVGHIDNTAGSYGHIRGTIEGCISNCPINASNRTSTRKGGYRPGRGDHANDIIGSIRQIKIILGVNCQPGWPAKFGGCTGSVNEPGATHRAGEGGHRPGDRINFADNVVTTIGDIQVALTVTRHAIGPAKGRRRAGAVGAAGCA